MDGNSNKAKPAGVTLPASFVAWLEGKDAARLEAIDYQHRTLYPHTLKRKSPRTNKILEEPVLLRSPSVLERAEAKVAACREVARIVGHKGAPFTIEQARAHVGALEYENLEFVELLSLCIRETKEPHGRMFLGTVLASAYGAGTLSEVSDALDRLTLLEDPHIPAEAMDPEAFLHVVLAIAKAGDPGPLVVIAGPARSSFIATMASQLATFLTGGSSPPPPATSTLEETTPPS